MKYVIYKINLKIIFNFSSPTVYTTKNEKKKKSIFLLNLNLNILTRIPLLGNKKRGLGGFIHFPRTAFEKVMQIFSEYKN